MLELNYTYIDAECSYRSIQAMCKEVMIITGNKIKLNSNRIELTQYLFSYYKSIHFGTPDLENAVAIHNEEFKSIEELDVYSTNSLTSIGYHYRHDGDIALACYWYAPEPTPEVELVEPTPVDLENAETVVVYDNNGSIIESYNLSAYTYHPIAQGIINNGHYYDSNFIALVSCPLPTPKVKKVLTTVIRKPAPVATTGKTIILAQKPQQAAPKAQKVETPVKAIVAPVRSYRVQPERTVAIIKDKHLGACAYNALKSNDVLDRRDAFKSQYHMAAWW